MFCSQHKQRQFATPLFKKPYIVYLMEKIWNLVARVPANEHLSLYEDPIRPISMDTTAPCGSVTWELYAFTWRDGKQALLDVPRSYHACYSLLLYNFLLPMRSHTSGDPSIESTCFPVFHSMRSFPVSFPLQRFWTQSYFQSWWRRLSTEPSLHYVVDDRGTTSFSKTADLLHLAAVFNSNKGGNV